MGVIIDGIICFNILGGIASSSQHLGDILLIIFSTWSSVILEKLELATLPVLGQWLHRGVGSCWLFHNICAMESLILLSSDLNLDQQSASWYFKSFKVFYLKSYGKGHINKHCSLGVACVRLLAMTFSKVFWSVVKQEIVNCLHGQSNFLIWLETLAEK